MFAALAFAVMAACIVGVTQSTAHHCPPAGRSVAVTTQAAVMGGI